MVGLFLGITRADCKEVSSSIKENGLLEITAPKNCTDKKISEHLRTLDIDAILEKQKKAKETFRKKIKKLIAKYAKEFDIPFPIDLRFIAKPKYLCNGEAEVNGIIFSGRVSFVTVLQFCPDAMVEKLVKYAVYMVAIRYEEICCNNPSFSVKTHDMMSGEDTLVGSIDVPESKYSINLKPSEVKKLQADYNEAVNQFHKEMEKQFISYI